MFYFKYCLRTTLSEENHSRKQFKVDGQPLTYIKGSLSLQSTWPGANWEIYKLFTLTSSFRHYSGHMRKIPSCNDQKHYMHLLLNLPVENWRPWFFFVVEDFFNIIDPLIQPPGAWGSKTILSQYWVNIESRFLTSIKVKDFILFAEINRITSLSRSEIRFKFLYLIGP